MRPGGAEKTSGRSEEHSRQMTSMNLEGPLLPIVAFFFFFFSFYSHTCGIWKFLG